MERNEAAWLHRTLRLELVPGKWFEFRTLSFYEVYLLWPHLLPMAKALESEDLVLFAAAYKKHFRQILGVINPILLANDDALKATTRAVVTTLTRFYEMQDWGRIKMLGEALTPEERATEPETREQQQQIDREFLMICAAAAHQLGMDVATFMQQRFEMCADAILILRDSIRKRAEEAGEEAGRKMTGGALLQALSGMMPAEKFTEDEKPGWMKEIERIAREEDAKRASKPS